MPTPYYHDEDPTPPRGFVFTLQLIGVILILALTGYLVEDDNLQDLRDRCYLEYRVVSNPTPEVIHNCIADKLKEQQHGPSN